MFEIHSAVLNPREVEHLLCNLISHFSLAPSTNQIVRLWLMCLVSIAMGSPLSGVDGGRTGWTGGKLRL